MKLTVLGWMAVLIGIALLLVFFNSSDSDRRPQSDTSY